MRVVLAASLLLVTPLGPAIAGAPATAPSPDQQLRSLYDAEWAWRQHEFARLPDDDPWDSGDDHLPRVDAATQQRRLAYWQATLASLNRIPADRLTPPRSDQCRGVPNDAGSRDRRSALSWMGDAVQRGQ